MHTSDFSLSHKILLTWLSWKAMPKQSYLDLSSKSHKSCVKALSLWELGPGSSWLTHSYEIHLHICICNRMYILIWGSNNYLKICVLYSYSCAGPIEVKGKDKTPLHNKHGERLYSSENQHSGITNLVRSRYHDSMSRVPQQYARGTKWRNSFKCLHNKR